MITKAANNIGAKTTSLCELMFGDARGTIHLLQ